MRLLRRQPSGYGVVCTIQRSRVWIPLKCLLCTLCIIWTILENWCEKQKVKAINKQLNQEIWWLAKETRKNEELIAYYALCCSSSKETFKLIIHKLKAKNTNGSSLTMIICVG